MFNKQFSIINASKSLPLGEVGGAKKIKHMKHLFKQTMYVAAAMILATVIMSANCSKKDAKSYFEENPLEKYLTQTGFDQYFAILNGGTGEVGLKFTPLVNGTINAITLHLPEARNDVPVTLWNVDAADPSGNTGNKIQTFTVNVPANDEVEYPLPKPISITKGKQYVISFHTGGKKYYIRAISAGQPETKAYPVTAGNIQILECRSIAANTTTFPTIKSLKSYAGDFSFVFQRTK
jgi:hypothetical protein